MPLRSVDNPWGHVFVCCASGTSHDNFLYRFRRSSHRFFWRIPFGSQLSPLLTEDRVLAHRAESASGSLPWLCSSHHCEFGRSIQRRLPHWCRQLPLKCPFSIVALVDFVEWASLQDVEALRKVDQSRSQREELGHRPSERQALKTSSSSSRE